MNTQAFLFDLDGVLIDTHDLHWEAWSAMKDEIPCLSSLTLERFKKGFGQSNDTFLFSFDPKSTKEQRALWGEKKEVLFRKIARHRIQFLPWIEPFLKEVIKAKIPMTIASSSPISNLEFIIHETPLGHYFSHYVSAQHVPNGKPAPDIFLEAAKRLDCPAHLATVFEDSLSGLQAARSSGAKVVGLATTYSKEELEKTGDCDLILSLNELNLARVLSL